MHFLGCTGHHSGAQQPRGQWSQCWQGGREHVSCRGQSHQASPPWSTRSCLCPSACLLSSPFLFYSSLSLSLSVSLPTHTLLLWVSRIENKVSRQFFSWSPDLNGSVSLRNEGLCWLAECSESLCQRTVFWCSRLTDPLRRGGRGKKSSFNYRGRSMVLAARSRPVSSASTWQGVLSSRRSAGVRPAFVRQLL